MLTQISRWMKDIKEVKNTLAHHGAGTLTKHSLSNLGKKLKTATLLCAGDTGQTRLKLFQIVIDQITTCSVDDLGKRIVQTTNKISQVFFINHSIVILLFLFLCEKVNKNKRKQEKIFC